MWSTTGTRPITKRLFIQLKAEFHRTESTAE